ncbi:MAG: peptidylprolyl isomerase [Lachnospiraceae bacterium]|nr:peptidylprolyl isomerase [Lachnospiraceae bacterium]
MRHPIAKMYTDKGVITIELYPECAPNTVNSFIWAAGERMYENRLIKRIVPGFVLQPSYCYFDDKRCDYMIEGEFEANGVVNSLKMEKWTVAMAGDGEKEAHGCEFFITLSDETGEKLQGKFAAFGKVIDGFEEVERLEQVEAVRVYPEGVSAIIYQPVVEEHMLDVLVETFGVEYAKPMVKRWSTEEE